MSAGTDCRLEALVSAAWERKWSTVSKLLAEVPPVDVTGADAADGATALHWAACAGHHPAVRALLARGADANARDNFGQTPVTAAAVSCSAPVLRTLLRAGGDVNVAMKDGWTPLATLAACDTRAPAAVCEALAVLFAEPQLDLEAV